MRIVHLVDSMEVGGAETIIALLCRFGRARGHCPSVHCLYEIGALGERLAAEGFEVTVHHRPTVAGLMGSLYRGFKTSMPDVVHCHNATAAIIGAVPARVAGVKSVVVTRHGLVGPPYSLRRELKFAVASRFCDWVIAVCEEARLNLLAAPFASRNRIVRIYNGGNLVNTNGTTPLPKIGFTLLHVSRLSPVKDQESLLRAFALAKGSVPDLQLWIVGDGPLRPKLQELARDLGIDTATRFFGEQADVGPFYRAADLFVMSSRSEGLPMSLLESMSAGVPSVVTDVGGMREVSHLTESVMTVPASDYRALGNAIRMAAENRFGFPHLRRAAQQCYEQNFTLERMATEYIRLYDRSFDYHPSSLSPRGDAKQLLGSFED
jgi:glycosyltransferase involved in cell wall biosynthesis